MHAHALLPVPRTGRTFDTDWNTAQLAYGGGVVCILEHRTARTTFVHTLDGEAQHESGLLELEGPWSYDHIWVYHMVI